MRPALLLCPLLLAACGQSGALYLPDAKPVAVSAPAAPAAQPSAEPAKPKEDETQPKPAPAQP